MTLKTTGLFTAAVGLALFTACTKPSGNCDTASESCGSGGDADTDADSDSDSDADSDSDTDTGILILGKGYGEATIDPKGNAGEGEWDGTHTSYFTYLGDGKDMCEFTMPTTGVLLDGCQLSDGTKCEFAFTVTVGNIEKLGSDCDAVMTQTNPDNLNGALAEGNPFWGDLTVGYIAYDAGEYGILPLTMSEWGDKWYSWDYGYDNTSYKADQGEFKYSFDMMDEVIPQWVSGGYMSYIAGYYAWYYTPAK